MKLCQICTTENAADAATCVACGEGSFAQASAPAEPIAQVAPPSDTDPTEPEPFRGGKRKFR